MFYNEDSTLPMILLPEDQTSYLLGNTPVLKLAPLSNLILAIPNLRFSIIFACLHERHLVLNLYLFT